jgi:hypothetical protein
MSIVSSFSYALALAAAIRLVPARTAAQGTAFVTPAATAALTIYAQTKAVLPIVLRRTLVLLRSSQTCTGTGIFDLK